MNHNCGYYEELIFSLPDDGLTDDEAGALRGHLRTCPDCRKLFKAFADVTETLKNDLDEAPAGLSEGAMARIYAYEKVRADLRAYDAAAEANEELEPDTDFEPVTHDARAPSEASIPRSRAARTKKPRRWIPTAAAACLVVVIGGAAAASGIFGPKGSSGASQESIVMEAAAEAPAPLPEEEPAMDGAQSSAAEAPLEAAAGDLAPAAMAYEMAEEESAAASEMDLAAAAAKTESTSRAAYTWENPAQVPEGREADFEKLIGAAAMDGEFPADAFHVTAAVEYHGVIYEFLTDDGENLLLWQDAAESAYPVLSPGSAADLWDIIG